MLAFVGAGADHHAAGDTPIRPVYEALAQDRTNLIVALDATFPDIQIPVKDVGNPDPTKSCNPPAASGEDAPSSSLPRAAIIEIQRGALVRGGSRVDDARRT